MNATKTLKTLLTENRSRDLALGGPGGFGRSHIPMTLMALGRMEAASPVLEAYARRVEPGETSPSREDAAVEAGTWTDTLGQNDLFAAYVRFFDAWTRSDSPDAVLRGTLDVLMKGVAGSAYHPLLRLGFAVDSGLREEIVHALAWWAVTWQPLPGFDPAATPAEPGRLLEEIAQATSPFEVSQAFSIVERMDSVYRMDAFSGLLRPVRITGERPLERISGLILELFSKSQDFTLLHALTSCQALRRILPYSRDPGTVLSEYWHSICAATVSASRQPGFPRRPGPPAVAPADWRETLSRTVSIDRVPEEGARQARSSYEHAVKLVYACRTEDSFYRRDNYLALAARELDNPSPFD